MPRLVTKEVYQYHELSDKAKAKARDWFREASANDSIHEYVYDDFDTIACFCMHVSG